MRKSIVVSLLLCLLVALTAGCAGSGSKAEQKESVNLVVSSNSGTVTVLATNIGHVEAQYDIYLDCFDKDGVKFDGTIIRIPYLKSGEIGRGNSYLPKGTATYKVSDVGSTSSVGTYRVYFNVQYQ